MSLILISVFLSVFILIWAGYAYLFAEKITLSNRLENIFVESAPIKDGFDEELQAKFADRVIKPLLRRFSQAIQKYTPIRKRDFIENKLDYAGRPFGWNSVEYLTTQYAATFGLGILAFVLSQIGGADLRNTVIYTLAGLFGGYLIADLFLRSSINNRQQSIEKALPDVLDLLTISIEAGLGFDAAMQRVVQKSSGPISEEFGFTLQEMRMGKTRKDALRDMSRRTGVADLKKFIDAIVQADQLGVSLGNVLRHQSEQMRVIRRQRIEEKAAKAPVKMLIPLVLFIFPTIFIVVLAPAILQIMETLGK